jgi:hypothetical protein
MNARDEESKDKFVWCDPGSDPKTRTVSSLYPWHDDAPNNFLGNENLVVLVVGENKMYIDDMYTYINSYFICEVCFGNYF